MDHERRWQPQPIPRKRIRRALVTLGRPHRVHRAGRAERQPDLRPLDGFRRRHVSGHSGGTGSVGRRVVARWQTALLLDARRGAEHLANQDAQATHRCQMDRGAAHRRAAELPARSDRVRRQRLPSCVRRAGIGRHAPAAHVGQFRSRRRRLDARRAKHSFQRLAQREHDLSMARVGDLRGRRGRRRHSSTDEAQGPRRQSDGVARRQAGRLHRLRLDDGYLGGQQDLPDERRRFERAPRFW